MTSLMVFCMVFLLSPQAPSPAAIEHVPGHIPIEALDPANRSCKGCIPAMDYDECDSSDPRALDGQDDPSSRPGRFWLNPDAPPPTPSPCPQRPRSERPNV